MKKMFCARFGIPNSDLDIRFGFSKLQSLRRHRNRESVTISIVLLKASKKLKLESTRPGPFSSKCRPLACKTPNPRQNIFYSKKLTRFQVVSRWNPNPTRNLIDDTKPHPIGDPTIWPLPRHLKPCLFVIIQPMAHRLDGISP